MNTRPKIKPYFRVPAGLPEMVMQYSLTDVELRIYLLMLRLLQRSETGAEYVRAADMGKQAMCSKSTAVRALRRLVDLRLLYLVDADKHNAAGFSYVIPSNFLDSKWRPRA